MISVNLTTLGRIEILGPSFKLMLTPTITAVLFTKVNVLLLKAMLVNPSETLSRDGLHMIIDIDHQCEWNAFTRAPEYTMFKVFLIKLLSLYINEQLDTELAILFKNDIT